MRHTQTPPRPRHRSVVAHVLEQPQYKPKTKPSGKVYQRKPKHKEKSGHEV